MNKTRDHTWNRIERQGGSSNKDQIELRPPNQVERYLQKKKGEILSKLSRKGSDTGMDTLQAWSHEQRTEAPDTHKAHLLPTRSTS